MTTADADLALAARVASAPQPLRLQVASRAAAYLGVDDRAVCAVVEHHGVVVPDAVVLAPGVSWEALLDAHLRDGAPVLLGEGRLRCGERSVAVRATRDTRVLPDAGLSPADAARARARLLARAGRTTDRPGLAHAWTGGHATPAALVTDAPGLVGRGPGLTPSGDDLCSGVLLVHRLAGTPGTAAAARLLDDLAPRRTTAASTLLLRAAGEGRAAPVVGRALTTLLDATASGPALDTVVDALLALGHTSGADLAAGLVDGLDAVVHAGSATLDPSHERNCA
ncbi:DUF2877 domain-containing protein [Nocardioides zeae]|uniref:DUF2877 domain-containing protein n=1 Tax=Nocardioides imazamoxiresistens TaxID=3231893 RepID=A0ABU3PXW2_9ACTN|nr:DUF2877 domain-containing protein [Nocardioides zeae]MDT9594016.1 DUF2877 domain-containing protein [Nocardioides zeae]